jgi:histidine triad (HIT) family protein
MDSECAFCAIAEGRLDADVLFRNERLMAFRDNRPQAPSHVLVISADHIDSLDELEEARLGGEMLLACRRAAEMEGLTKGYRVIVNVGEHAGRVPHLHMHVIGGRLLSWPPG